MTDSEVPARRAGRVGTISQGDEFSFRNWTDKGGPIVTGRRFSVRIGALGTMAQDLILDAQDVIFDPETRKSVAVIRNGAVFRNDKEGARIAYFG
jgi:hypothetical protein